MTGAEESPGKDSGAPSTPRAPFSNRWEIVFFLSVYALLSIQTVLFDVDINSLSSLSAAVAIYAAFESFVVTRLAYFMAPAILIPLVYLLCCARRPGWTRWYLDIVGGYVLLRMVIQLIGLNILVFDLTTLRFLLITQLFFFLPYALPLWGWIYWRLDTDARLINQALFRLECDRQVPRPVDYFVASFSTVFSASINAVKGNSARARVLASSMDL